MITKRIRVRLRVGIAVAFLCVVVPLTVAMVGILYSQNVRLANDMAEQAMMMAGREVAVRVGGLMGELANAVEISASFGRARQEDLQKPETLRPMLEELQRLPSVYSLYFGSHDDGEFFQVVRLSKGITRFGAYDTPPPEGAKWVLRIIDSASGERRDTYLYLADWGKILRVERRDPTYDPRARPWYDSALKTNGIANSGVYVFSGSQQAGLTLSRRLVTDNGVRLGVFGVDLSIAELARFLREQKVGDSSVAFILDGQGRLIGYPDPARSVTERNGVVTLVSGEEINDPVVSSAVKEFNAHGNAKFKVRVDGSDWLVHFAPFPERFGQQWMIGMAVAEDEFVGPLKRASLIILLIGMAFILLATLGIVMASRLLAAPIQALIGETERIRSLELTGGVPVQSPVTEIDQLVCAVDSMKAGLASFGTYVPKSLVQDIIRSGANTGVGGERRPVTIMFTDLAGFTQASETMEPEQVLHWLSGYFEDMSRAIHAQGGTIDKYIGDAVMAMWNAPREDPDHVANACRAMLACRRAAHRLGQDGAGPRLSTRMGLHTGLAMVGNVGSSDRMQYTVLGSVVNLASRVEGLNKTFGTELLVTEPVADAVRDRFLFRPFGPTLVVGATIPMAVFELVGEVGEMVAGLDIWNAAREAWKRQAWAEAADGFQAYANFFPDDTAAALFADRARTFARSGAPGDWDGVWRFSSK